MIGPISFETVNAKGEGGYFGGLEADCVASELLTVQIETEALLAEALHVLQFGDCSVGANVEEGAPGVVFPMSGFRAEHGSL